MTPELPEPSTTEKTADKLDETTLGKMVGKYTIAIVFVIAASLMSMGFGWPWFIAGLGPIFLIPILGVSFAKALDMKVQKLLK
ncbi:hypothetical protein SEA_ATUIN_295 [Arthrobacter phage Atuin]|nr:hypothetical protein SEA_ATUIN_94 [Arthrobacter phage Atuin]